MRRSTTTWRFVRAYWVTFVVIGSYLSVRVQAMFRSQAVIAEILFRKHKRNARRIKATLLALQGLFIKVGQLISMLTNFLPEEIRQELEGLQDQVPPRSYEDIEARIREEFAGRTPQNLFAEFSPIPIAAASIGQVHVARLHTGEKVAVKVQYPDIDELVHKDLATLKRILAIVSRFVPSHGFDAIYADIRDMIVQELDFKREAVFLQHIAQNFAGRQNVAFPTVVESLSTARVLTTRWEDGTKISDLDTLDAMGVNRSALARLVIETYCQQIFVDGTYHADPHPGNILVRQGETGQPCVVFLDFGAVASISSQMREGIIDFLQGVIQRDTERIVGALKKMGFVSRSADPRVLDQIIEYVHDHLTAELKASPFHLGDVKVESRRILESLADLRRMHISLGDLTTSFHVPKDWILLERTLLLLMGLCTSLDADLNPMVVIQPYLERLVLGPERDWSKLIMATTKDLALTALSLPSEIRKVLMRAQRGELEVKSPSVWEGAYLLYVAGHQLIITAIGISAAAIAVVLDGRGVPEAAQVSWAVCAIASLCLLGSMWRTRKKIRDKTTKLR